ncbi:carbamoyltransferase HypF [Vibrio parahaemolyticus]
MTQHICKPNGVSIRVKGKVQGVGFRPFVWQLAQQWQLLGEVLNDGSGVLIRFLTNANISSFLHELTTNLPPLAQVESISHSEFVWESLPEEFSITASKVTSMDTHIVPDAATCKVCIDELRNPDNRRYRYPFINCTHCGPRFTIIKSLPYDRPNTVMDAFPLCEKCRNEYLTPSDRRYHAEPIACDECGPEVQLYNGQKMPIEGDWLKNLVTALQQGRIIAIKSLGGFHLVCDATSEHAIQVLRERKKRQYKPFAVMVRDLEQAEKLALINNRQKQALSGPVAPIVLLPKRPDSILPDGIAPQLNEIGVMLPSNPIQHLLADRYPFPLVMTSANRSNLPPVLNNESAFVELQSIADLFLIHNRHIAQRCDDSIVRVDDDDQIRVLRRSRGFVPNALSLPDGFPNADGYLAYGGDLKSAFAIGKGRKVIVSQYLGDLTFTESQAQYQSALEHYLQLYQAQIRHLVSDKHPGYFSHQLAAKRCDKGNGETLIQVQHHHAHIASCLVENGWRIDQGKVLALALDGLGYGDSDSFWGGELVLADYKDITQLGGIPSIPFVGADKAAKEPWRSYHAHLTAFLPELAQESLARLIPQKPIQTLTIALNKNLNSHSIRSAGRFFDAVAASLNLTNDQIEFESQAALQLEAAAMRITHSDRTDLTIPVIGLTMELASFWRNWHRLEASVEERAYLFHQAFANAMADMVSKASAEHHVNHVALTGGVFHNSLLTRLFKQALPEHIHPIEHQQYSCGDGGLALGQLAVALAKGE